MPDRSPTANLQELEDRVATLLDHGQVLMAQDLASEGLRRDPDSVRLRVLLALSLIRTGAVKEAGTVLAPVLARFDTRPLAQVQAALRAALAGLDGAEAGLAAMADLVHAFEDVRNAGLRRARIEPALLLELGDLHLESWQRTGDPALLHTASTLLDQSDQEQPDARAGAHAALCQFLLDRRAAAARRAAAVLARAPADGIPLVGDADAAFRAAAALGLAALLAGQADRALRLFAEATRALGRRSPLVVPVLRQVRQLRRAGLHVPEAADTLLKPPGVVVFTGHMLDAPDQPMERFPPRTEPALRAEIGRRLERMDVQIGYSGAASGAELLFVEAMLERDGEVNIVLPFDIADYRTLCVAPAGRRWEKRFEHAMKLAHSVVPATREGYLGHPELFRFQNQMLHGLSTLRAGFLETAPSLLAVWDMMEGSLAGGAADFIDQWTDITRLQIIDIDEVRMAGDAAPAVDSGMAAQGGPSLPPPPATPPATPALPPITTVLPERTVRAMLFADLVGYSALTEARIPDFMAFMARISADLAGEATPEVLNTWGDAVFAVMPRAIDLVRFAFALQAAVRRHRSADAGSGVHLDIRISLHAGPVFAGRDPFNGRPNFFGSHINRAARLEPVTVPGHIYATQPFVALLTAEDSQRAHEAEAAGDTWRPAAECSYVGVMSLAKNFGKEAVYHLQPPGAGTAI